MSVPKKRIEEVETELRHNSDMRSDHIRKSPSTFVEGLEGSFPTLSYRDRHLPTLNPCVSSSQGIRSFLLYRGLHCPIAQPLITELRSCLSQAGFRTRPLPRPDRACSINLPNHPHCVKCWTWTPQLPHRPFVLLCGNLLLI